MNTFYNDSWGYKCSIQALQKKYINKLTFSATMHVASFIALMKHQRKHFTVYINESILLSILTSFIKSLLR